MNDTRGDNAPLHGHFIQPTPFVVLLALLGWPLFALVDWLERRRAR